MEVYLDNGNVTRVSDEVIDEVLHYYREKFGVPGGEFGHRYEEEASEALGRAREIIAKKIHALPEEIIFTSGTAEGNNLAIKGAVLPFLRNKGDIKIVTSPVERKCVLRSIKYLEDSGASKVIISVDSKGIVNLESLKEEIQDASFMSIQHGNQEIGTVQDIKAIGDIAEDHGVIYHADATHTFLKEEIDVEKIPVDLLTFSGHVIHAPLGSGALFIREGLKIEPLFHGPMRERGFRAGHPNIPALMGFAKPVELMKNEDIERIRRLRDYLIENLLEIKDSRLNGARVRRVCDNVNISFRGVEGEAILMLASQMGIILRTGSACYSESLEPSYVIKALGVGVEYANSSTRMVVSRYNTIEEMKYVVEKMNEIIEKLRAISPIYRSEENEGRILS